MDGIGPAPAPAGFSRAPGWTLSGIGASGLAATTTVLLFLYLTGRFLWVYNKEAAASASGARGPAASAPSAHVLPVPLPRRRAVPLSLLPLFVHLPVAEGGAPECAVCLSEFREREAGRLLPGCGHGFHEECIATWLQLNTTCPLCRAAVPTK